MHADVYPATPVVVSPTPAPAAPRDFHQPAGFVPQVSDAGLPHQINLTFATSSKQETVVLCNCGWVGTRYRPEVETTILTQITEWEQHVAQVGYEQVELA